MKFCITAGFNLKIAIVHDDKALFESLNTYLKELLGNSADIMGFSGGEEFLDVWRENGYDLIILDIFMGRLTGMDVAKEIRRHDREGLLFPSLATQSYRWSFSLMLFIVEAVISVPLFFYMKTVYAPAIEKEPSGFEWRYLWLIPEQNKTLELTEYNHQLTMQAVQYENLQEKIAEARRAKHNVRHHIAVMQEYLAAKDYAALGDYLNRYGRSLPDDSLVRFYENTAANAVLLYFAQHAKDSGIDYDVKSEIPQSIGISETDISVLLGNLLENALDACKTDSAKDKKIIVRANTEDGSLCVTVDNTFTGELKKTLDGKLISTKHRGAGLGTESVRSIAEKYGGICRLENRNGFFYASVLCRLN